MARQSKTELYAAIRRGVRDGCRSGAVMRKHGVSHPTVRQALDSAWPKPRKKMEPRASLLDPLKPLIDAMLRADLDAPRKQRHTVKRIFKIRYDTSRPRSRRSWGSAGLGWRPSGGRRSARTTGSRASTAARGSRALTQKGGVEGQIGWFRRNHFVPVPEVDSLAELNQMIDRWDEEDEARRIRSRKSGWQTDGGWAVNFTSYSEATALEWRGFATISAVAILQANGR